MPRVRTLLKHLDGPWAPHPDVLDTILGELRFSLAQQHVAGMLVRWTLRPKPIEATIEKLSKITRQSERQINRVLTGIEQKLGCLLVYRWHGKSPRIFTAPLIEACDLAARALKDRLGWLTGRIQEIGRRFGMQPRAFNELTTAVQEMQASAGWSNEQLEEAMESAVTRVGWARARTPWGLWRHFMQEAAQHAVEKAREERARMQQHSTGAETDEQPKETAGAQRAPQEAADQAADAAPAESSDAGGPAALPANDSDSAADEPEDHPVLEAARKLGWRAPSQLLPTGRRDMFGKPSLWRPASECAWRTYVEVASADAQRIALDILSGKPAGLVKRDIETLFGRGA